MIEAAGPNEGKIRLATTFVWTYGKQGMLLSLTIFSLN